jgi:hypothetical protein
VRFFLVHLTYVYHNSPFRKLKVNHLQSNIVEVKNEWSFTSTSSMYDVRYLFTGVCFPLYWQWSVILLLYARTMKTWFIELFLGFMLWIHFLCGADFTRGLPRVRFKNKKPRKSAYVHLQLQHYRCLGFVSPCIIVHSNKSTNQMHHSLRFIFLYKTKLKGSKVCGNNREV